MTTSPSSRPAISRDDALAFLVGDRGLMNETLHLIKTGSSFKGIRFAITPYDSNHVVGFTLKALPPWSPRSLLSAFRPQTTPELLPALHVAIQPHGEMSVRSYGEDFSNLNQTAPFDLSTEQARADAREAVSGHISYWLLHYSAADPAQIQAFHINQAQPA